MVRMMGDRDSISMGRAVRFLNSRHGPLESANVPLFRQERVKSADVRRAALRAIGAATGSPIWGGDSAHDRTAVNSKKMGNPYVAIRGRYGFAMGAGRLRMKDFHRRAIPRPSPIHPQRPKIRGAISRDSHPKRGRDGETPGCPRFWAIRAQSADAVAPILAHIHAARDFPFSRDFPGIARFP